MKSVGVRLIYGADTSRDTVGPVHLLLITQEPFKLVHDIGKGLNVGMKLHW